MSEKDSGESEGEIVSFEGAGHKHRHLKKDEKLKKMRKAFKSALSEKLKADRNEKRKTSKKKPKKKKR